MSAVNLVDVGARGGISDRWRRFYQDIDVRGFEPDKKECDALNSQKWPYKAQFLPHALGARDGEKATLYITDPPGCSSLLRPNIELLSHYPYGSTIRVKSEISLMLSRMDSVLKGFLPDVIKIDTQGTELSILEGAGSLLDTTTAVELEVEFQEMYINQALFGDIDAFMKSNGFVLRGLRRTIWRRSAQYTHAAGGQLMHGDVLYVRPELLNTPKGHIILAAYKQYDLLALYNATHLIPQDPLWVKIGRRLLSRWDARSLRGVLDRLRPVMADDWHDADFY